MSENKNSDVSQPGTYQPDGRSLSLHEAVEWALREMEGLSPYIKEQNTAYLALKTLIACAEEPDERT